MKDLCKCGIEADEFLAKLDGAGWTLAAQVGEAWLCPMCLRERRGPAKAQRWDMPTNPEGRVARPLLSVLTMSSASFLLSRPSPRVPSGRT